jgi:hypothetical protein
MTQLTESPAIFPSTKIEHTTHATTPTHALTHTHTHTRARQARHVLVYLDRNNRRASHSVFLQPAETFLKMSIQMLSRVVPSLQATSSLHSALNLATSASVGSPSLLTWDLHSGLLARLCSLAFGFPLHFRQALSPPPPKRGAAGRVAGVRQRARGGDFFEKVAQHLKSRTGLTVQNPQKAARADSR